MPSLLLPGLVVPKARPNFDPRTGRAYTPKRYAKWLEAASQEIGWVTRGYTEEQISLQCAFLSDGVHVQWEVCSPVKRPKGVTGDVDNLAGSIMDALTHSGRIKDDKQVVRLESWVGC